MGLQDPEALRELIEVIRYYGNDAMRFVSEHDKKEEVKEKDSSSVAAVAKEETTTNQVF
jgi:hypothetical protein